MKQQIFVAIPAGFLQQTTCIGGQLHAVVEDTADDAETVCVLQWDGQTPYVEVLNGDLAMPTLALAGWPRIDRVQYMVEQALIVDEAGTPILTGGGEVITP